MALNLRIGIVLVALLIFFVSLSILKKGRMPVKYSLIWLFSSLLIFLVGVVPNLFIFVSNYIGFETMSNFIIAMFIFILLMINMSLTIIVSGQKKKITLLIQEVSMLKDKYKNGK